MIIYWNNDGILNANYPIVDYGYWRSIKEYYNDSDICNILDYLLKNLDCTKEYTSGRPLMTTYPTYNNRISEYIYYISKLVNQFLYNEYIDKLAKRHYDNIEFELANPYKSKEKNKRNTKKKSAPNKFIKQNTIDLFTGENVYVYENFKTKEVIKSNNPDLLNELNSVKKKKETKIVGVPLSAMTFNFKNK